MPQQFVYKQSKQQIALSTSTGHLTLATPANSDSYPKPISNISIAYMVEFKEALVKTQLNIKVNRQ
jgi:hypothetical protein